jgi:hypothetical protein
VLGDEIGEALELRGGLLAQSDELVERRLLEYDDAAAHVLAHHAPRLDERLGEVGSDEEDLEVGDEVAYLDEGVVREAVDAFVEQAQVELDVRGLDYGLDERVGVNVCCL